jgi:cbb3-type cytochrome oxidase maturation protein
MDVLLLLIPVSIALAAASVVACLVAIRGGQYDDLESPRWRILFDDRRDDRRAQDDGTALLNLDEEPTGAQARRSKPF